MKNTYLFLQILFLCALALHSVAQNNGLQNGRLPASWRTYLSHNDASVSIEAGNLIYSLTSGGMFSYNKLTQEVKTFSTVEGMSDITATTIYQDPGTGIIFIGYENGLIDYFSDPSQFRFLTDIERNTFFTRKRINAFSSDGDDLFVATDFGMVVYDLNTFLPSVTATQFGVNNESRLIVRAVDVFEGRIWVGLENNQLYSAPVDFPNLSDPSIWQLENGLDGLAGGVDVLQLGHNSSGLFARTTSNIWLRQNGSWQILPDFQVNFTTMSVTDDNMSATAFTGTGIRVLSTDGSFREFFVPRPVLHTLVLGDTLITAGIAVGVEIVLGGEITNITPDGPRNNFVIDMATGDGEIYVAPRGFTGSFGPIFAFDGIFYQSPDSGWNALTIGEGELPPNRVNISFARAFYDVETQDAYLGSWGGGLLRLRNGQVTDLFDCFTGGLSTIEGNCDTTRFGGTRVSGIDKDLFGNVWISLALAREPLMAFTPDGQWIGISASRFPSSLEAINMIIDDLGNKWILARRNGVIVYNDNGTLETTSDDRMVNLRAAPGLGNLPTNEVFSIAKDRDGEIWVGTSEGVTVFFDPFSIGQGVIVDASAPIFNGRFLLENETIFSIAVDGGDRKWFATANGAFLISADGTEQIHHFTEQNSPLISNRVNHVSIDQQTGEVFFGTDKGIISFQGDATEVATGCDDLLVFPNPVFTDFQGDVTIQGIPAISGGATVRITTVSGSLVREVEARGGTATWDGLDLRGDKVHSGIYLALTTDQEGEQACVGKFAVIRR